MDNVLKSPPNLLLDKQKNFAFITAVSETYIEELIKNWDRFDNWDVCVLTDTPDKFKDAFYVEEYKNAIFSYVDKFTFAIRMAKKFKRGGFCIDADTVYHLKSDFLKNFNSFNEFRTFQYWDIEPSVYKNTEFGNNISRYLSFFNLDILDIKPVNEQVVYIPYIEKLSTILYEIERIKPILEYTSLFNDHYPNLGHGEGIALAIALKRLNLELKLLELNPYTDEFRKNHGLL